MAARKIDVEKILAELDKKGLSELNDVISELEGKFAEKKKELAELTLVKTDEDGNPKPFEVEKVLEISKELKSLNETINSIKNVISMKRLETNKEQREKIETYRSEYQQKLAEDVLRNFNDRSTNFTRMQEELEFARLADQVPLLIGDRGIGKSATVKDYAKKIGAECIVLELAQTDVVEFMGYMIPREATGKEEMGQGVIDYSLVKEGMSKNLGKNVDKVLVHEHTIPDWLAKIYENDAKGIPTVLFLDEINRGDKDVMNAIMNLVNDKKLGQKILPPSLFIVSAMNPDSGEYSVNSFDSAQADRFVELDFEMTYHEWRNKVAPYIGIHDSIIRFLDENPEYFQYEGTDSNGDTRAITPRGWERVSRILEAYETVAKGSPGNRKRALERLLKGVLKIETVSLDFAKFYIENNRLRYPDLVQLINKEMDKQEKYIKEKENVNEVEKEAYGRVMQRVKNLLKQYEDENTTSQDVLNEFVEGAIKEYLNNLENNKKDNIVPIGMIIEIAGPSYIKQLQSAVEQKFGGIGMENNVLEYFSEMADKYGSKIIDLFVEYRLQNLNDKGLSDAFKQLTESIFADG